MATLTFPLPSGRAPRGRTFLSALLNAFHEGVGKARRYQTLARKSDAELAALGINREDLPRIVMFGKSPSTDSRRARR
jgi:uncharacterized protein YjiS (DUF1127 family)